MTKRSAEPVVKPLKMARSDDGWALIPESSYKNKDFKPVEGGPKIKPTKAFVLSSTPKIHVTVSMNGCNPEVRFTADDSTFTMTGEEFIQMTGMRFGSRISERIRFEPNSDELGGFRIARYGQTSTGMQDLNPLAVFNLSKYAAVKLKTKAQEINEHIGMIIEDEQIALTMAQCVVDAYKTEYARLNSLRPINEHFHELSRIVEIYVPGVAIVRDFLDKMEAEGRKSHFNHYALLSVILAQTDFLYECVM